MSEQMTSSVTDLKGQIAVRCHNSRQCAPELLAQSYVFLSLVDIIFQVRCDPKPSRSRTRSNVPVKPVPTQEGALHGETLSTQWD